MIRRLCCHAALLGLSATALFAQKPAAHCGPPVQLACAGAAAEYAGIVREMNGDDCYLQSGKQRPVRAAKLKKLHAGDALQCECNSTLTVGLITGPDQTTRMQLGAADECFQVPLLAGPSGGKIPPHSQPGNRSDAELIVNYGDPGGPPRSQMAPVYSPSQDGAARPEDLIVRWAPSGSGTMALTVWDEDGNKLWPEASAAAESRVEVQQGQLASASLRQALLQYRDKGGEGTLELRVVDSAGQTYRVLFSLLSKHSEEVLDQELAQCDANEKDALLHLCRAAAYRKFKLFPEMAAEYDQALALAPGSEDLLRNAIAVNERTGNVARVEELKASLQKLSAQ